MSTYKLLFVLKSSQRPFLKLETERIVEKIVLLLIKNAENFYTHFINQFKRKVSQVFSAKKNSEDFLMSNIWRIPSE